MLIPEEILQKQTCSTCRKYLSVGPVKVYPNRQVKCGRCTDDDDIGVESKLFPTMMKYMLFPCINYLEGCRAERTFLDMKFHEGLCEGYIYECLICQQFEGSAFHLNNHCKSQHTKEILEFPIFCIDLSKGNYRGCYFYHRDNIISFITYVIDLPNITLDVRFGGKKYQGDVLQQFELYSVKNNPIFKTDVKPCSRLELMQGEGFTLDKSKLGSDKENIICKFRVIENRVMIMEDNIIENYSILNSEPNKGIFRWKFNHKIAQSTPNLGTYMPGINYVSNIPLKLFIFTTSNKVFCVTLEWDKADTSGLKKCVFNVTCTLFSSKTSIEECTIQRTWKYGHRQYIFNKPADFVFDPRNRFVENGFINIEVKVEAFSPKPKIPLCQRALVKCDCPSCS